jgi:hypothetical protein
MKNNNILNKMNIQEPADKLAKEVGKPLKFHIGNREATFFTKSTEYGKLLDNNHNDYLQEENAKRATRAAFAERFHIGSDAGESDIFGMSVDEPDFTQANIDAAREEMERQQMEREDQNRAAKAKVREQVNEMMQGVDTGVGKKIREVVKEDTGNNLKKNIKFLTLKQRPEPTSPTSL